MAAKTFDPTANPFELLANAENQSIVAPERRKKAAANKDAVEEPVGVVPTPAAKAQARAAKEAAVKATKPDGSPADNQGKQEPAKKKLTREQFEEEKRKGNNILGDAPASSDVSTSGSTRPPRARGDGGVSGRGRGGGRGRGDGRGRGRGDGLGRGRGDGEKSGGGRGDKKDANHHYQPPTHGREYDKKSQAKTTKNAPFKKGGSGGGGNYGTTQDDLAGQTGVDNVEPQTEDAEKTTEKPAKKHYDGEESEEEEKGFLLDEYLKKKAEADAALLAKIGGTVAPRKVEGTLSGTVTKVDEEKKEAQKEKPKTEEKVETKKVVSLEDYFHVRAPPVFRGGRGRGEGRGRGRGEGRGRGRGGRGGDNNASKAGNTEGEQQQTAEADQPATQSNNQGTSRGGRGRGGEGRGRGRGGEGRGGRGQGEGRGEGRGRGQGQSRGDSNGRGRGGKRGGRPNLDTSNTRHFPDLGAQ